MTNYNQRLDKILSYERDIEGCQASHAGSKCLHCNEDPCPHCKRWGGRQRTEVKSMVDDKTKQAITSLTKELVAEAKPLYYASPDKSEYQDGFNTCIRLFEHNLLKALEEV